MFANKGFKWKFLCWITFIALAQLAFGIGGIVRSDPSTNDNGRPGTHIQLGTGVSHATSPSRVDQVEKFSDSQLRTIYNRIRQNLQDTYRKSGSPVAAEYQSWQRYNSAPYKAPDQGEGYNNNYANPLAKAYEFGEKAGIFQVGAILAKDNFVIKSTGEALPGPLTIMEKMPPGFNAESRDWRFSQIKPDGTLFGMTNGVHPERMVVCLLCHATAGAKQDYVFFVPEKFRAHPAIAPRN